MDDDTMPDDTDLDEPAPCPACDGESTALGPLGRRQYFRCRCCGALWSTTD